MSEKYFKSQTTAVTTRFGSSFWDGVECELEVLDAADFEDFLAAEALPIQPSEGFREQLSGYLKGLIRSRFAH